MQLPRIGLTIIKASRADLRLMVAMIKDVMVRLDGTSGDDVRLAAVNQIAVIFESHITGLFFNVLPEAGDVIEATVFQRLTRLQHQPTCAGST
jgi:uncharacterized protein YccT (UPF0319 family)